MEFLGIEKLSLVDYDNHMCCTLFVGGCNFRCPFCHNSDLVLSSNHIDGIPFNEILEYLNKRKGILEAVCITGGEPTLMVDLKEKIKTIKELGYLIKLDTNGSNPLLLKELVEEKLIDYVAMDIKNSFDRYSITIGKDEYNLDKIKESIEYLKENHIDYEFRTTIIDEYHSEKDMIDISIMLKGAKKYFLQKFIDNEHCIKNGLHEVSKEKALKYKHLLSSSIDNVNLRGY